MIVNNCASGSGSSAVGANPFPLPEDVLGLLWCPTDERRWCADAAEDASGDIGRLDTGEYDRAAGSRRETPFRRTG